MVIFLRYLRNKLSLERIPDRLSSGNTGYEYVNLGAIRRTTLLFFWVTDSIYDQKDWSVWLIHSVFLPKKYFGIL